MATYTKTRVIGLSYLRVATTTGIRCSLRNMVGKFPGFNHVSDLLGRRKVSSGPTTSQSAWICFSVSLLIVFGILVGEQVVAIIDQTALELAHNYKDYGFRQMLRRDAERRLLNLG